MSCVVAFTIGASRDHLHLLAHVADLQTQIDGSVLAHDQRDAGADLFGKAVLLARTSYWPMGSASNSYRPAWSVIVVRETPVSRFFAVTVAPDTTAPVWSVTRPDKLAETWATAESEERHNSKEDVTNPGNWHDGKHQSSLSRWLRRSLATARTAWKLPAHGLGGIGRHAHSPRSSKRKSARRFNRIEPLMSNGFSLVG